MNHRNKIHPALAEKIRRLRILKCILPKNKQTTKPQQFINRHKSPSHGLLFYLALQVSSWAMKLNFSRNPWTQAIRRSGRTKQRRWRQTLQTPWRWRGGWFLWCGSRGGSTMGSRRSSAGLPKTTRTNWSMGATRTIWLLIPSTRGPALGQSTAFRTRHSNALQQHVGQQVPSEACSRRFMSVSLPFGAKETKDFVLGNQLSLFHAKWMLIRFLKKKKAGGKDMVKGMADALSVGRGGEISQWTVQRLLALK